MKKVSAYVILVLMSILLMPLANAEGTQDIFVDGATPEKPTLQEEAAADAEIVRVPAGDKIFAKYEGPVPPSLQPTVDYIKQNTISFNADRPMSDVTGGCVLPDGNGYTITTPGTGRENVNINQNNLYRTSVRPKNGYFTSKPPTLKYLAEDACTADKIGMASKARFKVYCDDKRTILTKNIVKCSPDLAKIVENR